MVAPLSSSLSLGRSVVQAREALADLQRQLATGKKFTSYGDLGLDRSKVLSLRSRLSQVQAYQKGLSQVEIRLDVMLQTLTRVRELGAESRTNGLEVGFDPQAGGKTIYQVQAAAHFDEVVAMMNTQIGGRYLFAGRDTEGPPVAASGKILGGSGSKAGFAQIVAERRQADLGGDGRGRLIVPAAAGGSVSIAEDAAGSPFGFKLTGIVSTLTGTTASGPAGATAAIDVTFTGTPPRDGETVRLSLLLPDGTETEVTLTARSGAVGAPGDFFIGADAAATAGNFQAALADSIETKAQTSLRAASLFAAANNFFDFDENSPPQRVDGPPFDSATALRDATEADTVFWYQGELSSSSARQSVIAKADDAVLVAYGVRANEEGLSTLMKQMAVLAVETFDVNDPDAPLRYAEMKRRAVAELSFPAGSQSPNSILTELTAAKTTLGRTAERHKANALLIEGFIDKAENSDIYELGAQIISLQGRLEASLQVSASLRQLSLINFL